MFVIKNNLVEIDLTASASASAFLTSLPELLKINMRTFILSPNTQNLLSFLIILQDIHEKMMTTDRYIFYFLLGLFNQ